MASEPVSPSVSDRSRMSSGIPVFNPNRGGFSRSASGNQMNNPNADSISDTPSLTPRKPASKNDFPQPKRSSKLGSYRDVKRIIKGKGENEWRDGLRGSGEPGSAGGDRVPASPVLKGEVFERRQRSKSAHPADRRMSASEAPSVVRMPSGPDPLMMPSRDPSSAAFRSRGRSKRQGSDAESDAQSAMSALSPRGGAPSPAPPSETGSSKPVAVVKPVSASSRADAPPSAEGGSVAELKEQIEYYEALVADKNTKLDRLKKQIDMMEQAQELKWSADLAREAAIKKDFAKQLDEVTNKLKDTQEQNDILTAKLQSLSKDMDNKGERAQDKFVKRERQLLLRIRELEKKLEAVTNLIGSPTSSLDASERAMIAKSPKEAPPPVRRPTSGANPRVQKAVKEVEEKVTSARGVTSPTAGSNAKSRDRHMAEPPRSNSTRDILAEKRNLRNQKKAELKERESERSSEAGSEHFLANRGSPVNGPLDGSGPLSSDDNGDDVLNELRAYVANTRSSQLASGERPQAHAAHEEQEEY